MPSEQDNDEERQTRIDRMVADLVEIELAAKRLADKLRDEASARELAALVQEKAARVAAALSALKDEDDQGTAG